MPSICEIKKRYLEIFRKPDGSKVDDCFDVIKARDFLKHDVLELFEMINEKDRRLAYERQGHAKTVTVR